MELKSSKADLKWLEHKHREVNSGLQGYATVWLDDILEGRLSAESLKVWQRLSTDCHRRLGNGLLHPDDGAGITEIGNGFRNCNWFRFTEAGKGTPRRNENTGLSRIGNGIPGCEKGTRFTGTRNGTPGCDEGTRFTLARNGTPGHDKGTIFNWRHSSTPGRDEGIRLIKRGN